MRFNNNWLNTANNNNNNNNNNKISSPITLGYEPHSGPVYSIKTSPLLRSLFITSSADCGLNIYYGIQPYLLYL